MPSPWPPPAPPCIPLQFSAFLHALLAPKELAAVDALGGPRTPAVPMGAQRVAGQALAHCSEEGGIRGDTRGRFQVQVTQGRRRLGRGPVAVAQSCGDRCWATRDKQRAEVPGPERKGKAGMPRRCDRTQPEAMARGQASQSRVRNGAAGMGRLQGPEIAAARGARAPLRAGRRGARGAGLPVLPHSASGRLALCSRAWWGFRKSCSQGTVWMKQRRALRWMRASPLPSSRSERSPSQLMRSPCRVSE